MTLERSEENQLADKIIALLAEKEEWVTRDPQTFENPKRGITIWAFHRNHVRLRDPHFVEFCDYNENRIYDAIKEYRTKAVNAILNDDCFKPVANQPN